MNDIHYLRFDISKMRVVTGPQKFVRALLGFRRRMRVIFDERKVTIWEITRLTMLFKTTTVNYWVSFDPTTIWYAKTVPKIQNT